MIGLSKDQAAALAGIGVRRFNQIAHEDDPPIRSSDGTYPPKEFGDWLRRRQLASLGVAQDGTVYDYDAERARLTHHQANIADLDEQTKRGVLIPAADVEREWSDAIATSRAALLALPGRLAAMAVAATGLREIEDFARDEVHRALYELAGNEDSSDDPPADPDPLEAAAAADG